jgi:transcriptional regulator of acetoin/glycerol metabolism
MERTHILNTLEQVKWNRKRAAALLQISTTTLWRRLKEFEIEMDGSRRVAIAPTMQR